MIIMRCTSVRIPLGIAAEDGDWSNSIHVTTVERYDVLHGSWCNVKPFVSSAFYLLQYNHVYCVLCIVYSIITLYIEYCISSYQTIIYDYCLTTI